MSWGERSCINFGDCNFNPNPNTCNSYCQGYVYNGVSKNRPTIKKKKLKNKK